MRVFKHFKLTADSFFLGSFIFLEVGFTYQEGILLLGKSIKAGAKKLSSQPFFIRNKLVILALKKM